MNTNHDELERLLGDELNDRAGDIGGARLHFGDVRGRATSIRRRRGWPLGPGWPPCWRSPYLSRSRRAARSTRAAGAAPGRPPKLAQTTLTLDGLERGDPRGSSTSPADGVVLPGDGLQRLDDLPAMVPSGDTLAGAQPRALRAAVAERRSSRPIRPGADQDALRGQPGPGGVAYTHRGPGGPDARPPAPTNGGSVVSAEFPAVPRSTRLTSSATARCSTRPPTPGVDTRPSASRRRRRGREFEGRFVKAIAANPETGLVTVQTKSNPDTSGCFGVVDPAEHRRAGLGHLRLLLGCVQSRRQVRARRRSVPVGRRPGFGERVGRAERRPGGDFRPERGTQVTLNDMVWESTERLPGLWPSRARTR